jgi:hypothetical protein
MMDNQYEYLIGIGIVSNIQDDGIIQITLDTCISGRDEEYEKLKKNDATIIRNVRVKSQVPSEMLYSERKEY